ncbi:MAG: PaaI family thioesterase [Rhodospirillales bacterium]
MARPKRRKHAVPIATFGRHVGYRVAAWRKGRAELRMKIEPRHLNRSGMVHGGVLMTLIDAACGYAGSFDPKAPHPKLTSSLSITVNFLANTDGGVLRAVARRVGGGRNLFFARAEVLDQKGRRLAEGVSTFRFRSDEAARASHARQLAARAAENKGRRR